MKRHCRLLTLTVVTVCLLGLLACVIGQTNGQRVQRQQQPEQQPPQQQPQQKLLQQITAAVSCPSRCNCIQRTVRCMRQQFTEIPDIPRDTQILDLRYNRITAVPTGVFAGHTQLHTIFLNENQIVSLAQRAFDGLPSLKYLYLNKNRISKIHVEAFNGLDRLQTLYLQYNEISTFAADTFADLPKLEGLFLYFNKITHVPSGSFRNMPSLKRLRLDSNALRCDCSMVWLMKMLKTSYSRIQAAATCNYPERVLGRNFNSLREEDFHCKKPIIMEGPNDVEVNFGGTATFTCHAAGDPAPDISWMLNSNEIQLNDDRVTVTRNGSLRIENAAVTDIGQYECMAKNTMGEVLSRPARFMMRHHTDGYTVGHHHDHPDARRPKFVQPPRSQVVSPLDTIVLHCAAIGVPEPHVAWYFNGRPLMQSTERVRIHSNGTLVIDNPTADDSGVYKCEANNFLGGIVATADVKVNVVPRIVEGPDNQTLKVGATASFECIAEGAPKPRVTWRRNGRLLRQTNRIFFENNNSILEIEHVKVSDSGKYVCVVENGMGKSEASAQLTVQASFGPPRLIFEPYDLEALPYSTVEIPCKGDGDPPPVVAWKKDGRTIETSARHQVNAIGSLYITNVTDFDGGRYECSLTNEHGRATGSALITIRNDESLAPGDRFVRIAFAEASREVDTAINQTVAALFSNATGGAHHHGDLFRMFRFPEGPSRDLARAAELYERTLVNIRRHVESGHVLTANYTDYNYTDLLSTEHKELVARLSGCTAHRQQPNCTNMCYHAKYRTIDGTCNNMKHPMWGASLTGFRRLMRPTYENGFSTPIGWQKERLYSGYPKPLARLVSTTLITTEEITPDTQITHMVMQWGQFLDHDLDHALPSVTSESWDGVDCKKTCEYAAPCYPIEIPENDPRVKNRRCIDFVRSSAVCGSGMTSVFFDTIQPREQLNQLTSFLDGSQVYGYAEETARDLRNLTTDDGLLREGIQFPGQKELLPFASPAEGIDCRRDMTETDVKCFTAGDIRVNEQVGLLSMHILWFREHNRLATALHKMNPHWVGDTLYQEARKIVGAQLQHITYAHWLPLIIGPDGMRMLGSYGGYNPTVNPSITNEFATAALRFGHSLINPILHRLNASFEPIPQGHLPLHKAFFAPWRVVYEGGIDPLMRGLYTVPAKLKMPTQNLNVELTERLFETAHAVALDLAAINIQRGRDHAIPGYNQMRGVCNMTVATTFDDLRGEIKSAEVRQKLEKIYGHPSNIDIWVGGILEDQLGGARVGPLFRCILIEQFRNLRDGDRFWYENPSVFSSEQLAEIKHATLGRVLCENGDNITRVTDNVFLLPGQQGGYKQCASLDDEIDLKWWIDCKECQCKVAGAGARRSQTEVPVIFQQTPQLRVRRSIRASVDQEPYHDEDNFLEMNDERIEGLEAMIDEFQKSMRQMRRKIKKMELACASAKTMKPHGGQCVDEQGNRRLNNEVWSTNECTRCECRHHQVNCVIEKCAPLHCDSDEITVKQSGVCCATCEKNHIADDDDVSISMPTTVSSIGYSSTPEESSADVPSTMVSS